MIPIEDTEVPFINIIVWILFLSLVLILTNAALCLTNSSRYSSLDWITVRQDVSRSGIHICITTDTRWCPGFSYMSE